MSLASEWPDTDHPTILRPTYSPAAAARLSAQQPPKQTTNIWQNGLSGRVRRRNFFIFRALVVGLDTQQLAHAGIEQGGEQGDTCNPTQGLTDVRAGGRFIVLHFGPHRG